MNDRLPGTAWSNPVWHRGWRIFHSHSHFYDYAFVHDDYDGADDANDNRCGAAGSIAEAKAEIDEREAETNELASGSPTPAGKEK